MCAKRRHYHHRGHGHSKKPSHGRQILQSELESRGWTVEMRKRLLPPAGRVNVADGQGGSHSERFWWERDVLATEGSDQFRDMLTQELQKKRRRERQMQEFLRRMEQLSPTSAPKEEYPLARGMKRRFVLHVGPTNSGKTYEALERLKTAETGVYLGPLRLLALEIYDRFRAEDVPCSMVTGEEAFIDEEAGITACTIEMMDTTKLYDVAVIRNGESVDYAAFETAYNALTLVKVSGTLPAGTIITSAPHTAYTFTDVDGTVHTVELATFDALHDAVIVDAHTAFYLIKGGFKLNLDYKIVKQLKHFMNFFAPM